MGQRGGGLGEAGDRAWSVSDQQADQVLHLLSSDWKHEGGAGRWEEVVGRKTRLSDALDFESVSLITPFLNKETWTQ